jgi:putative aldouronate transport system permease protein
MLFSGGLIPTYVLIVEMGLNNTWWALLLPGALAPWNVIIIRSYYLTIPHSLEEAAKLDGASNFKVFLRIYVPMSMPVISTQILFTAVGFWNAWSGPLLYFDSSHSNMYPLSTLLKLMLDENSGAMGGSGSGYTEPEKMATTVIATLPIIVSYPFMQKYFISGMTLGSVKE